MTRVLAPGVSETLWSLYPLLAGIAVVGAIEEVVGVQAQLKWPNDVLWKDRKLGGILCEGVRGHILIGLGINVRIGWKELATPGFDPVDLEAAAGGLRASSRRVIGDLADGINWQIDHWCPILQENRARILNQWRLHCCVLGKRVRIMTGDDCFDGVACDIAEDGALMVKMANGRLRRLYSGDVSLRLRDEGGG